MTLLEKNLAQLKERFPLAYRMLKEQSLPQANAPLSWSSHQPPVLKTANAAIHPYGKEDSKQLMRDWLSALSLKQDTLHGLTGFGNGSHVVAALEALPQGAMLFVAEHDISLLRDTLAQKDFTEVLSDSRLLLSIGPVDSTFFKLLEQVSFAEINSALPLLYSPWYALNEDYYSHFLSQLAQAIEVHAQNYHSNVRASGFYQEQIINNLPELIDAPDIGLAQGLFQNKPLILVGAGPSLDEAIPFLQKAEPHAIIASVNSSYQKLVNHGIKPHVTLAADPRIFTYRGYEGIDTEDVFLICSTFVSSPVLEKFKGRTFTWSTNQQFVSTLRKRLGLKPPTELLELGTISCCVVDLARHWGCSKICLVGQDMAVTDSGRTHSNESFYAQDNTNHIDLSLCRQMPGNTRDSVYVENHLFAYLKTFEQLVEDLPQIQFLNTARLGARIHKVPYADYDEALQWIGNGAKIEPRATLNAVIQKHANEGNKSQKRYLNALAPTRRFAQKVYHTALEAALFHEALPMRYQQSSYAQNKDVLTAFSYADKLNKLIDSHPEDYRILFDGETKKHLTDYSERTRKLESSSPHWEQILKNREYFWALAEGARFLHSRLESSCSNN